MPPMETRGFYNDAARLMGLAALVRANTRYARHRPYQERVSESRN